MGFDKEDGVFFLLLVASFVAASGGNVIDCVDIYKQPALDNPLLKDHKIQMGDSSSSSSSITESGMAGVFSFGQGCPDGTIPILRTTKGDSIREKLLLRFASPLTQPYAGFTSRAGIEIVGNGFYGAKAAINIWSPECRDEQFSASLIRLASGHDERGDTNAIYVGWAVCPSVYGDVHPHLLTFWRGGNGSTECFDMLCPGFVQTDKGIVLGAAFNKTSDYGGIQQQFVVQISQDPVTKNWILRFGDQQRQAGYWPKELFPLMAGDTGATRLFFGGITMPGPGRDKLPPMGSGNKPAGSDVRYTAFMNQMFFSEQYAEFIPLAKGRTKRILDNSEYYGLNNYGMTRDYGYFVTFGGPGGGGSSP